ncbi:MAG: hypothetical protein H0Z28_10170 [Archaeoglobus sp.]|nr:hypothetical protein [Archaeoglobus sp.]
MSTGADVPICDHNPPEDLISEFEAWLRRKGYSESTVRNWVTRVRTMFRKLEEISKDEIHRVWYNSRLRHQYLRAYNRFSEFLEDS